MSDQKPNATLKSKIEVEIGSESSQPIKKQVSKSANAGKNYLMDLRIQSPQSLGLMGLGGLDAAPALIRLSRAKGIDIIGVADYLSGAFIDRAVEASKGSGVSVIPGVVIRCSTSVCNDISLLCLFDESATSAFVSDFLRVLEVPEKHIGDKNYVIKVPLEKILKEIELRGALCIPTRMDKTPYRILAIPELVEKYGFRAFDICYPETTKIFKAGWPKTKFQFLSFSNASALAQVGSRVAKMKLSSPLFSSIKGSILRE